jgi:hypothetical protein
MPNGYRIPPHSHPSYEHVEIKEGTLLVGTGDKLDSKMTQALAVGDSATAPAGIHHFSIAKGRTLLSATSWARTRLPICGLKTRHSHGLSRSAIESPSALSV